MSQLLAPEPRVPTPLECLTDREVHAPAAALFLAVHEQTVNRFQLPSESEADRPDRRRVPQAGTDRIAPAAPPDSPRVGPAVPRVEEQHAAAVSVERRAKFFTERKHAVAADRQPLTTGRTHLGGRLALAQRAHFVTTPPTNARRAAENLLLRERHVRIVEPDRPDVPELQTAGEDHLLAER